MKKIWFEVNGKFDDGSKFSTDPSWWEKDLKALIARIEKTPREVWKGEKKTEFYSKVKDIEVTRTVRETVAEWRAE